MRATKKNNVNAPRFSPIRKFFKKEKKKKCLIKKGKYMLKCRVLDDKRTALYIYIYKRIATTRRWFIARARRVITIGPESNTVVTTLDYSRVVCRTRPD